MLEADSSSQTAWNYLGKISVLRGDKRQALHDFCRLAALAPGVALYNKELAVVWSQLGNENAAGYYYRRSYRSNPHDPDVVVGLADYLTAQQRYPEADTVLDRSLGEDSLDAAVICARIRSAYSQDDYADIFLLAARLERMDNITLVPFLDAAIGYYYTSDYAACVRTCDLLITHQLKTRTVLYLEAMAFRKQKKYKLSLALLNECIALAVDSKAADYYVAKADIYEALGAYRSALRQYDTAYYYVP
jgi:tetratricopeptide (TPR) repeat protein